MQKFKETKLGFTLIEHKGLFKKLFYIYIALKLFKCERNLIVMRHRALEISEM